MTAQNPQRLPEPTIKWLSPQRQTIMDCILSAFLTTQRAQLLTIRETRRRRWRGRRCCRQRWRYRSRSMSRSMSSSRRLCTLASTRLRLDSCCSCGPVHVIFCCGAGGFLWGRRGRKTLGGVVLAMAIAMASTGLWSREGLLDAGTGLQVALGTASRDCFLGDCGCGWWRGCWTWWCGLIWHGRELL